MVDLLLYLVCFLVFAILQSWMINGLYESFKGSKVVDGISHKVQYQGMIFYMLAPAFFEKYKHRYWSKNLWSCVKCMSSTYGALTYWPTVIWLFNFRCCEVFIFIADVFILIYLNFFFYNKA